MLSDFLYFRSSIEQPGNYQGWLIVWFKRTYLLLATGFLLLQLAFFRWQVVQIFVLVILGKSRIKGNWTGLTDGDETSLGRCENALHDKVNIDRRLVINNGALHLTATHFLRDKALGYKKAPITIGKYAWLATNGIILLGVTIGRGAVVGADAVFQENELDYDMLIGNPSCLMHNQCSCVLNYAPVMLNAPFESWVGRSCVAWQ